MALATDQPWKLFVFGGIASCCAETATVPIDVVKVRLQMDGQGGAAKQYKGGMDCLAQTIRKEGAAGLTKGLSPALLRQSTYGSLRLGIYEPIKQSLASGDELTNGTVSNWCRLE